MLFGPCLRTGPQGSVTMNGLSEPTKTIKEHAPCSLCSVFLGAVRFDSVQAAPTFLRLSCGPEQKACYVIRRQPGLSFRQSGLGSGH